MSEDSAGKKIDVASNTGSFAAESASHGLPGLILGGVLAGLGGLLALVARLRRRS